ncbi:endonuclease/exonuclease/phosphatase family protein [Flavobacterium sp. ZT3R17]|uniref:endonuclease/exonuclease/phosphatase family protein n=1 Tax=Flavobacterium cryoconiti TaxID=3398736 RepID=UPI003A844F9D
MKILTWNLERLIKNKNQLILDKLSELDADILILTETNSIINPGEGYSCIATESLSKGHDGIPYKSGENRTTIWTKYKIEKQYKTFANFTSVSAEIKTPLGLLNIYGTIIGVFGGKDERFKTDLESQLLDFKNLLGNICIAGDFNVYMSGYAYPSHEARKKLNQIFDNLNLKCLTSEIADNVDHIVLSKDFIKNQKINIETWNLDKKLSDHIGICIHLSE